MLQIQVVTRMLFVVVLAVIVGACSGGLGDSNDGDASASDSTIPDSDSTDSDSTDSDGAGSSESEGTGGELEGSEPEGFDSNGDIDGTELTEAEILTQIGQLDGQLAIGNGPQVAVARPDGLTLTELDGSETTLAAQPTWSRDGLQLAWSSVSADRQVVAVQPFDEEGLPTADRQDSTATGSAVYYMQWNHDSTLVGYLRTARRGRQVEFGTLSPGSPLDSIGNGAPFFISWSPESTVLAANINQNSLALIDGAQQSPLPRQLVELDGQFNAPDWIDDSTVIAVIDGWFVKVNVVDGAVERLLDVGGAARFVLSPDRTKFAFQSLEASRGGDITQASFPLGRQTDTQSDGNLQGAQEGENGDEGGRQDRREIPKGLIVVDIESGQQQVVTTETVLGWEWSPDSEKLAWMSTEQASSRPLVQWHFWSSTSSDVVTRVSPKLRLPRKITGSYLPFFDQYAQSVTRWGPDSSAFAFAGILDGRSGIWVQLVGEPSVDVPVEPQLVASGDFVTWGYGPTPEPVPTGGSSPS